MAAARELLRKWGAEVVSVLFLMELDFLKGRGKLPGERVESLIHY